MSKSKIVPPKNDEIEVVEAMPSLVAESVSSKPNQTLAPEAATVELALTPKVPGKTRNNAITDNKDRLVEAKKETKAAKVKKPKLIRDSFTIPEADYALFAILKQRALAVGVEVKKGEILRAAVATLAKLADAELVQAISLVERIKTGRPKK